MFFAVRCMLFDAYKDIGYAIHLNSNKMKYYQYAMKLLKELEENEKIEE